MPDLSLLIQQGTSNLWVFMPTAILLGALHGLEPGHSKTMMAAFIIAIRGTLSQAILLGLAATISHTAIVWIIALGGLYFGNSWHDITSEAHMQLASSILIIAIASWMIFRTWKHRYDFDHRHSHTHSHDHHQTQGQIIDTGHGIVKLAIAHHDKDHYFRLDSESANALTSYTPKDVTLVTQCADDSSQTFTFKNQNDYFQSRETIKGPLEFMARLSIGHGHHSHDFDVEFTHGGHIHALPGMEGLDITAPGYQDPHELAHANDIRNRFTNRQVTTIEVVLFGITGGLVPCPASITVLLICLQLKKIALGTLLVFGFSIGLALTMVASGVVAALSVKYATRRSSGFSTLARRAPYVSGGLMILIGLYMAYQSFGNVSN
ncbi:MAG: nickel/cobalt efflux transporter RcnA [Alphaproteobacteria bacterium]|nr:nickel/cobalt efflux transporter RcnA [Alphaproteobacteria bacterium]